MRPHPTKPRSPPLRGALSKKRWAELIYRIYLEHRQLSRAFLESKDALAAAETERELTRKFPRFVDRDEAVGRVLALDAMAAGGLPLKPLYRLLHDGDCSPKRPCVLAGGGRVRRGEPPADAKRLVGQQGLYVLDDAEAAELQRSGPDAAAVIESGADASAERFAVIPAATACTVTSAMAYNGFTRPMLGQKGGGYDFMENPDSTGALFKKTINQSGKNDAWVFVGSATLTKDVRYRIDVATNTGEVDKKVAVDDFLLIKPNLGARANLVDCNSRTVSDSDAS